MYNVDKTFSVTPFQTFRYICPIIPVTPYPETDLTVLTRLSADRELENDRFKTFLLARDSEETDREVARLNTHLTQEIDCTQCGNCCKSLLINISEAEADVLSGHLKQDRAQFDACYVEKGSHGIMIMNQVPCHFLADNKCGVYEHRFSGCREFPALHLPGFSQRLFTVFMHYGRCPIVFNVVEQLKEVLQFDR